MTDKEIINQWKHERELAECVCSYFVDQVELSLVNETIDLINRQQAENKELAEAIHNLTIEKDALFDKAEELKAEIERLKGSVIINNIMEIQKIKRKAKSEAYKEFAKKLNTEIKKAYINNLEVFGEHLKNHKDTPDFEFLSTITGKENALRSLDYFINNLLKEMVGEEKNDL